MALKYTRKLALKCTRNKAMLM